MESARDVDRDGRSREGGRQRLTERGTDLDRDQLRRREREGDRGREGYHKCCRENRQVSSGNGGGHAGGRCGGSGGRRGATSEANIQLNKDISACGSTSRLCDLITKHAGEFNDVNLATAFRKLLLASRRGMPRGVVEDAQSLHQCSIHAGGVGNVLQGNINAAQLPQGYVLVVSRCTGSIHKRMT